MSGQLHALATLFLDKGPQVLDEEETGWTIDSMVKHWRKLYTGSSWSAQFYVGCLWLYEVEHDEIYKIKFSRMLKNFNTYKCGLLTQMLWKLAASVAQALCEFWMFKNLILSIWNGKFHKHPDSNSPFFLIRTSCHTVFPIMLWSLPQPPGIAVYFLLSTVLSYLGLFCPPVSQIF